MAPEPRLAGGWFALVLSGCAPRPPTAEPKALEIGEERARGVARQTVGDPCRDGEVQAHRREHAGRPMWRVACSVPVSRESVEVHVVWIDAVTARVDAQHSDIVARGQPAATVSIDEATAIELARARLGIRCLRSTFEAGLVQRDGRPWWDVACRAEGDDAEHVSSALIDATTGEVELDQFQLDVHGPRPARSRPIAAEPVDAISETDAIRIARKLLRQGLAACRAERQSFDSGRRWAVTCRVAGAPAVQTIWVDAATGVAELEGGRS